MDWLKALRAGERLTHAATWKSTQVAANAIAAILTIGIRYLNLDIPVSDEEVLSIAGVIVTVVNIYFTMSTSRKMGIK